MKNALTPIPGAKATGKLANNPIINVATAAEIAVAKNTPPTDAPSIPLPPTIKELTGKM